MYYIVNLNERIINLQNSMKNETKGSVENIYLIIYVLNKQQLSYK